MENTYKKDINVRVIKLAKDYVTNKSYLTVAKNYRDYCKEQKDKNNNSMRKHYTDMRPIEDINKYIRVVEPPKLTKKQIEEIMNTPIYKRIGLSLVEYMDKNLIKDHEKDFAKRFTNKYFKIKWITKREKDFSTGNILPNNDFIWNNEEWELKGVKTKKYSSISKLIKDARKGGKRNLFIDFGKAELKTLLAKDLSTYNLKNPTKSIKKLYMFDREGVKKILLKKK